MSLGPSAFSDGACLGRPDGGSLTKIWSKPRITSGAERQISIREVNLSELSEATSVVPRSGPVFSMRLPFKELLRRRNVPARRHELVFRCYLRIVERKPLHHSRRKMSWCRAIPRSNTISDRERESRHRVATSRRRKTLDCRLLPSRRLVEGAERPRLQLAAQLSANGP